jgi:isopenicillin-N epimerase
MSGEKMLELGAAVRPLWGLAGDAIHLNHGSFGAIPLEIRQAQATLCDRIESHPDGFFRDDVMPGGPGAIRRAASALAEMVGTTGDRIALVENATTGIEAVLRTLEPKPGEHILITDHQYPAVLRAVERRCRETGAVPLIVHLPFPLDLSTTTARIADAMAGKRVALAILDHITSPTALVLPIAETIAMLKAAGVPVLIDGAHSVGQIALDLDALGADWYVSNAHKWLYAARGTAFLHTSATAPFDPLPILTSHFVEERFPLSFDYVGTRDYSAWAALPMTIAFWRRIAAAGLTTHCRSLVDSGTRAMGDIGAVPVTAEAGPGFMRTFILPQSRTAIPGDEAALMAGLWKDAAIQVGTFVLQDRLLIRFSTQVYVTSDDIDMLVQQLDAKGWPGR